MDAPPLPELHADEQRLLAGLVWEALLASVRGGVAPDPATLLTRVPPGSSLRQPTGVFVTLRLADGQLRGCMGRVLTDEPVVSGAIENARAAAERDPRFPPLRTDELRTLTVDISLLSPLARLPEGAADRLETVTPGTHGLFVRHGRTRGVLLPQVATAWGWGAEEFLRQCCLKAGLAESGWQDPAVEVFVFRAATFRAPRVEASE